MSFSVGSSTILIPFRVFFIIVLFLIHFVIFNEQLSEIEFCAMCVRHTGRRVMFGLRQRGLWAVLFQSRVKLYDRHLQVLGV